MRAEIISALIYEWRKNVNDRNIAVFFRSGSGFFFILHSMEKSEKYQHIKRKTQFLSKMQTQALSDGSYTGDKLAFS